MFAIKTIISVSPNWRKFLKLLADGVYSLTRVDLDCDYLHTLYILYYNNTYWKYGMCVIHNYYQQLLLVKKAGITLT